MTMKMARMIEISAESAVTTHTERNADFGFPAPSSLLTLTLEIFRVQIHQVETFIF
jgi:hypothetical protein